MSRGSQEGVCFLKAGNAFGNIGTECLLATELPLRVSYEKTEDHVLDLTW